MYAYRNVNRKLRSRKGLKRLMALSTPLFAFFVASASLLLLANEATSTAHNQNSGARVFTEGLDINLDRSSPAYAALEDTWMEPNIQEAEGPPEFDISSGNGAQQLAAGSPSELLAERILNENRREEALIAHEKAARAAQTRALAQAATKALREMADKFQSASIQVASEPEPHATPAPGANSEPKSQAIHHPTQTISLSDLKMSREELLGTLFLPLAQADKPSTPGKPQVIVAKNATPPPQREERTLTPSDEKENERGPREQSLDGPVFRQVFVSGPIEFSGGIALANAQDRVVIFRERDGEVLEAGAVWLREGRYEIFLEDTEGVLVAELRTTYGDILGRGLFDLAQLPSQAHPPRRIDPVSLKIKPVPQGVVGQVFAKRAGPPTSRREGLKDTSILFRDLPFDTVSKANGRFEEPNLLEGSSVVVKASRMGYWGTMAFASAGSESEIDIFPDQPGQTISELISVSRSSNAKNASIIWGRVTKNGAPVAGATVDLMTSEEGVRPIYFNSAMLPDLNLKVTSSNGLYAFYPVAPGAHAVQAHFANHTTDASIFPADERTVSRIDLETQTDRPAKIRVFDAFRTDWPLTAAITDPSRTRQVWVDRSGETKFKYAAGKGPLILDVDAGRGYQLTRLTLDRDRRSIYVPMVQSAWLDQIRNSAKFNPLPGSGVIVGFVQGPQAYRVALEEKSLSKDSKIIFFNSRGEPTGKDFGEPGGGFLVLNVQQGFRTITIQPSGTTKVFASLVLVDPNVTNVITHWIR